MQRNASMHSSCRNLRKSIPDILGQSIEIRSPRHDRSLPSLRPVHAAYRSSRASPCASLRVRCVQTGAHDQHGRARRTLVQRSAHIEGFRKEVPGMICTHVPYLKAWRKSRGYSSQFLAHQAKISRQTIWALEAGVKTARTETIIRLAHELD